jgi:hypothetical protein
MPPISFVFDRLIDEVERRVGNAISRDEIESSPSTGPAIVDAALVEVFGEPNTREALVIMSSIDNIDVYTIDTRPLEVGNEVSSVIKESLYAIINQRLQPLRNDVAAVSFAAGFAPVAEKLVALAEKAIDVFPASKWISSSRVADTRVALERVLDKCGTPSDLKAVLLAHELFSRLLKEQNDDVAWGRHGLDFDGVRTAIAEFRPFQEMLEWRLALVDDALTAISNRAPSELRPGSTAKASALTISN